MNIKVLRNVNGKAVMKASFRGRTIILLPKRTMKLDLDDEEQAALYHHILITYGFVLDITSTLKGGDTK